MITKHARAVRSSVCAASLVLGVGLGVSGCSAAGSASGSGGDEARTLAGQLNDRLAASGLSTLDTETATALYGTDGGVSCENVGELQQQLALSQFGNNSVNLRRVVLDPSLVSYDLAVIETYCPDQLGDFEDLVDELDTEETVPTP
ncbi:hypothetical protein [Nocardioides marmotae]|uniref:hypothetical protein n=1 Tax=Nocardioides marmotae TaxID=2663857 RepID=UPI0012B53911|nr:hypothetical protein [Nocardioides marmotae]MBC9734012.1 hypothetical protein [Nocardioides marmotae]MTB85115.1 hypothetical protein [Nocardioides marmotae]